MEFEIHKNSQPFFMESSDKKFDKFLQAVCMFFEEYWQFYENLIIKLAKCLCNVIQNTCYKNLKNISKNNIKLFHISGSLTPKGTNNIIFTMVALSRHPKDGFDPFFNCWNGSKSFFKTCQRHHGKSTEKWSFGNVRLPWLHRKISCYCWFHLGTRASTHWYLILSS